METYYLASNFRIILNVQKDLLSCNLHLNFSSHWHLNSYNSNDQKNCWNWQWLQSDINMYHFNCDNTMLYLLVLLTCLSIVK